jgi:hypothetical protein
MSEDRCEDCGFGAVFVSLFQWSLAEGFHRSRALTLPGSANSHHRPLPANRAILRRVEESWQTCSNKCHAAEALEESVWEAVAGFLSDPERIGRQIEDRIKRKQEAVRDPEGEATTWVRKLVGPGIRARRAAASWIGTTTPR